MDHEKIDNEKRSENDGSVTKSVLEILSGRAVEPGAPGSTENPFWMGRSRALYHRDHFLPIITDK